MVVYRLQCRAYVALIIQINMFKISKDQLNQIEKLIFDLNAPVQAFTVVKNMFGSLEEIKEEPKQ